MSKTISLVISDELLAEIDKRAKEMYISRSAFISTALSQKLQADDVAKNLPDMIKTIKEFKDKIDNGEIIDSQLKIDV